MAVQPIPKGYHTLTPYIAVDDASAAIEFYKRAFGATERGDAMRMPDGSIAHAELQIGDSVLMLSDPFPQGTVQAPKTVSGTTSSLLFYVEDVDAALQRAVDAGATLTQPAEDQFWGDRWGTIMDPFGHHWQIATHIEDLTPDEMEQRAQESLAAMVSA